MKGGEKNQDETIVKDFLTSLIKKKSKGQLSIFLAMCVISIITMLAFVVNVGLYVKARINLQNAVDSAAYAGAASQARMLTNIAYLNWELHNTYKEWMMKYYVIGNLSMSHTRPGGYGYATDPKLMIFRQRKLTGSAVAEAGAYDAYNFPSICIHFGSDNNICEIARVPGIPRFESVGIPGVSEKQEAFLDEISKTKSKDCSERTVLNWGVAALWAYGTGTTSALKGVPSVASNRVGAWVQALELAMRIRNLEIMVNRPPVKGSICAGNCDVDINSLSSEYGNTPFNERPIKAFLSAYKNLGGDPQSSGGEGLIKQTFKLYELAPTPFNASPNSLSGFLLKGSNTYLGGGETFSEKHYLDLQAIPLNLVTFFTSFVVAAGSQVAGVTADGACQSSKTALPVPGYIFGFAKNPDVVTYYAVKGEAKYTGLLNPFQDKEVTLRAYSVAMPFGGRIGPRFFDLTTDSVTARSGSRKLSRSFVTGIKDLGAYKPGSPIPSTATFWATTPGHVFGGTPQGGQVRFAIPNMFYEINIGTLTDYPQHFSGGSGGDIEPLKKAGAAADAVALYSDPSESMGLYEKDQYEKIFSFLGPVNRTVSAVQIDNALYQVRRPTFFDANNYMIPLVETPNVPPNMESLGMNLGVTPLDQTLYRDVYNYLIYAPLYGQGLNYVQPNDILLAVQDYLKANQPSINTFIDALKEVAVGDGSGTSLTGGIQGVPNSGDAYKTIYDPAVGVAMPPGADNTDGNPVCLTLSLAQKFNYFLSGQFMIPLCGITPVHVGIMDFFQAQGIIPTFREYYTGVFVAPPPDDMLKMMTAYFPGARQGAEGNAANPTNPHPLGLNDPVLPIVKRNSYSVKFVQIQNAIDTDDSGGSIHRKVFFEDGTPNKEMSAFQITSSFVNMLQASEVTSDFGNDLHF